METNSKHQNNLNIILIEFHLSAFSRFDKNSYQRTDPGVLLIPEDDPQPAIATAGGEGISIAVMLVELILAWHFKS